MRRIWLAVGLAAGMVVLCGLLLYSTGQVTQKLDEGLTQLAAAEEGDVRAGAIASELNAEWDKAERWMALHVRHSELEEVTQALTRVEGYWKMGQYDLFRVACDEAKVAVDHLWQESCPSLRNIV